MPAQYTRIRQMETIICAACGKAFTAEPCHKRKYCSHECKNSVRPRSEQVTCEACGKVFTARILCKRRFCSGKCAQSVTAHARRHARADIGHAASCEWCGKEIWATKSLPSRFCSRQCHGHWNSVHKRGEAHPMYGRKFDRPKALATIICEQCGKPFTVKACYTTTRRFCSRACGGKWKSENWRGEASVHWRGGGSRNRDYGSSWREARRAVRKRDKVCVRCGASPAEIGHALDVHHVIPFRIFGLDRHEEANALTNLIGLCRTCHMRAEPR